MNPRYQKLYGNHGEFTMLNLNPRQQQILERIQSVGELKITDLKQQFDVTDMTIRRDLEKLELTGDVRRTFGGVVWIGKDIALQIRSEVMLEEKIRIGKKAAQCIQSGESIFIDGGSTTLQLARSLQAMTDITVVTNALNVAYELQHKQIPVILTGGMLREATSSLVGPITSQILSTMVFDRIFLGASGFTLEHGFSNTNLYEAEIKRLAVKQSKEAYIVMDHTKLGKKVLFSFAEVKQVQHLIIDEPDSQTMLEECREAGMNVIMC